MTAEVSLDRYSRQMRFYGIGEEGQRRLLDSHVTLCGCGALGTVLANALVRAGVGHLRLVDRDFIETNNLQRQVLFDEHDVAENLPKEMASLYWPKNMYWRKPSERFVRPVRWLVAMLDGESIPLEFGGIRAA